MIAQMTPTERLAAHDEPDLRWLAFEAAIELDNSLRKKQADNAPTMRLSCVLNELFQERTGRRSQYILLDPMAQVAVRRAVSGLGGSGTPGDLSETLRRAGQIATYLRDFSEHISLKREFDRSKTTAAKEFCLRLSKGMSELKQPLYEPKLRRPNRK